MTRLTTLFTLLLFVIAIGNAQVVTTIPVFPTVNDTVTIIFDATQGNGALAGTSPVYAHTGLITDKSNSPSDWKNVQGSWGTADPRVLMTDLGNNRHSIRYHIRSFYNVNPSDTVEQLSFVFRNATGSTVGRSFDGSDIYTPVYDNGLYARIVAPTANPAFYNLGDQFTIYGAASRNATMELFENGTRIATVTGDSLGLNYTVSNNGKTWLKLVVTDGADVAEDSVYFVVNPPLTIQNPPAGVQHGINYMSDTSVILSLFAPDKENVYVLGDFNDWEIDPAYLMNVSLDNSTYWVEISGLTPGEEYAFQYLVDGVLRIADPYTDKVLDPFNDPFISSATYPGLMPYPSGKASGIVSVLQTAQQPYQWAVTNFVKPDRADLVVYELHIRDFIAAHDYATLIDTLDYLQDMGINCIELMPIMEFEGNNSWGYNPSFYFAVDKYYGPKNDLKRFIDTCHARGIAVVLDMVLNHAFGQCPLVQLYWDGANNQPAANSPWFNQQPTHDFNVGYDFNHDSPHTIAFTKRVLAYWLEEYKFDGYRMDLSKGFTQKVTIGNVGAWGAYDGPRIAKLKEYYDFVQSVDPEVYFILEHFADNSEERELANYGMMIWGNLHFNYKEAALGYPNQSNLSWSYYGSRGWNDPHAVVYMESHDEERLVYENLQYGNRNGSYNIKDLTTALARKEMVANVFYTIPGPKMLWQFGELGYDVSINQNGRTGPKPIRWNYLDDPRRLKIYKVTSALIKLKTEHEVFKNGTVSLNVGGVQKRVKLSHPTMNVVALSNMNVVTENMNPDFQNTGWWYEYFSGDSINVTNTTATLSFQPGEYRLYTNKRLPKPDVEVPVGIAPLDEYINLSTIQVFPNPANAVTTFRIDLDKPQTVRVEIVGPTGQRVAMPLTPQWLPAGTTDVLWNLQDAGNRPVANGYYQVMLWGDGWKRSSTLLVVR